MAAVHLLVVSLLFDMRISYCIAMDLEIWCKSFLVSLVGKVLVVWLLLINSLCQYFRINYALYEELDAQDMERSRDVYR